jgi:hypothetical protein
MFTRRATSDRREIAPENLKMAVFLEFRHFQQAAWK